MLKMLLALKERANLTPAPLHGICREVLGKHDIHNIGLRVSLAICRTLEDWPEYSGSHAFPISSHTGIEPGDEYLYIANGALWDASTEYGAARHRALDYLIENVEVVERHLNNRG